MKTKLNLLCGAVALSLAGQASAAVDWVYATSATGTANSFAATAGGATGTATAWANTGPLTPTNTDSGVLAQQTMNYFYNYGTGNGLGINNFDGCANTGSGANCDVGDIASTAPEHAIDNQGRNEMVLLSFTKSVNLTGVQFGWTGKTDGPTGSKGSQYTILAYTGTDSPVLKDKSWGSLDSGWTIIKNYQDASSDTTYATGITSYSSYWLIGAYNPLGGLDAAGFGSGNDYLKLASVSGTVCTSGTGPTCVSGASVPEPGSLALFGFALMGMMGLRKRRQG